MSENGSTKKGIFLRILSLIRSLCLCLVIRIQRFFLQRFFYLISLVFDLFAIKSEWQLLLLLLLSSWKNMISKRKCLHTIHMRIYMRAAIYVHMPAYMQHMNALYAVYRRRVNEILLPSMVRSVFSS